MSGIAERFRDNKTAEKVCKIINDLANGRHFRLVHICGTHEDAIMKFGLRTILPHNVEVLMGPGCPVCTVPPNKIDYAIKLAKSGVVLTTFGDMMRVPSALGSLADAKARRMDIRIVYSIHDSIKIAEKTNKNVTHFGVGFETTAPTTASELDADPPNNFSVFSAHLLIPPAMEALLKSGEKKVDGFINPGHVSAIIGEEGYRKIAKQFKVPQVIAGFEPLDILFAIAMLLKQINEGRSEVENAYSRVVKPQGNERAIKLLEKVFEPIDAPWRGMGIIPKSGLTIRSKYADHDALKRFDIESDDTYTMPQGCRCGEVLRAVIYPRDCPLFNHGCTTETPIGPCMVSREGSCYIASKYGVEHP